MPGKDSSMLQRIAFIVVNLVIVGVIGSWASPPPVKDAAPQVEHKPKSHIKTVGELRSKRHHECFRKHQKSIAKQLKGQGKDFHRIRKQVQEIRQQLSEADPELASLKRQRNTIIGTLASTDAKSIPNSQSELAAIEKKLSERQAVVDNHPELKPLIQEMQESSRRLKENWRNIAQQDKSCSELLTGVNNTGVARKPTSGNRK
jgi:seryl-tRNA synthetase